MWAVNDLQMCRLTLPENRELEMKRKEGRERIGTLLRSRFMLVDVGKYCSREAVALEGAGSVPELPVAVALCPS